MGPSRPSNLHLQVPSVAKVFSFMAVPSLWDPIKRSVLKEPPSLGTLSRA